MHLSPPALPLHRVIQVSVVCSGIKQLERSSRSALSNHNARESANCVREDATWQGRCRPVTDILTHGDEKGSGN